MSSRQGIFGQSPTRQATATRKCDHAHICVLVCGCARWCVVFVSFRQASSPSHVCDRGGTALLPTATHAEYNTYASPNDPAPAALESEVEALARQLAELDSLSALAASPATQMAPLPDNGDVVEKVLVLRIFYRLSPRLHGMSCRLAWALTRIWACWLPLPCFLTS